MKLCKSCKKIGYDNCYECVWETEAESAKLDIAREQQQKAQNKLVKHIRKLFCS